MNSIEREVVKAAKAIAKLEAFLNAAKAHLAGMKSVKTESALRRQAVTMDHFDLRVQKLANNVSCGFGDIGYELDEAANDILDAREEKAEKAGGALHPELSPKMAARMAAARKAKPRLVGARKR